jgi:CDGSH-type Zn-finger protein
MVRVSYWYEIQTINSCPSIPSTMTRIVVRDAHGPKLIRKDEVTDNLYICQCGLSRSQPFCDGSHKMTLGEPKGAVVRYREAGGDRVREPVRIQPLLGPEAPAPPSPEAAEQPA